MARSNYADKAVSEDNTGALPEHRLLFGGDHRAFTPAAGASDDPNAGYGKLAIDSTGDWAWKPGRNNTFAQFAMPAFLGVPKGMPEQLAAVRELEGEHGAVRYGNEVLPIRRYSKLIPSVIGGWFDTLAGSHVGSRTPRRADVEVLGSDIDRSYSASDSYGEFCPA